jgi:hypothetical protein
MTKPPPHIVWTLRRTGGTTLASLLSSLSSHPTVEHEPFNQGRAFGGVANAYEARRLEEYERGIREIIASQYVIKHCFEVRSWDFNLDLASRFSDGGYKNLILIRKDEPKRLLSLAVALETGSWGPAKAEAVLEQLRRTPKNSIELNIPRFQVEHERCQQRLARLQSHFESRSIPYRLVFFEDVYKGDRAKRIERLEELLAFLELGPPTESSLQRLFTRAQKSNEIYDYIANSEQFLNEVTRKPSAASKLVDRFETSMEALRAWTFARLGRLRRGTAPQNHA